MRKSGPLPPDWPIDYLDNVDFDKSFAGLVDCEHFHAATMRGRIRSLQLRLDEAKEHFQHALRGSQLTPETDLANLKYQFLLNVFRFDHLLLEQPVTPGTSLPDSLKSPNVPRVLISKYPELRHALNLRDHAHSILLLHMGEYAQATEMWRDLLHKNPDVPADKHIFYHVGLAAALFNLGDEDDSLRNAENAGLAIATARRTFHRAHGASMLIAFYTFVDDRTSASEWKAFLEGLKCPRVTKDLFLRRADIMLERCNESSSLLLI